MPYRIAVLALALTSLLAGCAGSAWRNAREVDTISAYHQFLRDHPDTSFSAEAKARLELARVRKKPTREAFEAFREKHSDPALEAELRPFVEEAYFAYARAVGNPEAYRAFLEEFSDGGFARRAQGNLEYLENHGYIDDLEGLAGFAERYPESDYSAEVQRSVAAVALRQQSAFSKVGLVIQVSSTTPGWERVARVFQERAVEAYRAAGLTLVGLPEPERARELGVFAVLTIRHDEQETSTELEGGRVTEPGVLARTQVSLRRVDQSEPIWSDTFDYRAPLSARRDDLSILFAAGSQASYWAEIDGQFFVPVARWSTQVTARKPLVFEKSVMAVEVVGQRAVVVFGDGDFQVYDLGDPTSPVRLGGYRRARDLSTFDGVSVEGSRVAVYGADGVEFVRLDGKDTRREVAFGRDVVGSAVDVEIVQGTWLAATNRGLLQLGDSADKVRTLLDRPILGMARLGERVVFTDGVSLFVAQLGQLQKGRVEAELRLGRGFSPRRVRVHGQTAVVLGARDAVWVDLRRPQQPQLISRIGGSESGRVHDAAVIGNRLFLLGLRGLQVADPSGERVVDSVDVSARTRVDVAGRHLVMIGEKTLQVVDATAFLSSTPAAPKR